MRPFAQHERQRLLDVDVLAGAQRRDGHERVPVIGRGDDHRVDVLAVEHLAEVLDADHRTRSRPGRRAPAPPPLAAVVAAAGDAVNVPAFTAASARSRNGA